MPNTWVVDSGSTSHIARNNSSFSSMKSIPRGTRFVYLGTTALYTTTKWCSGEKEQNIDGHG
jgi:hypothetical protein